MKILMTIAIALSLPFLARGVQFKTILENLLTCQQHNAYEAK
jgi:hypothetical protein